MSTNYGVCTKTCQQIGELLYNSPIELNPGDLVKIVESSNRYGSDSCIVQIYNHERDNFDKDYYRCVKSDDIELLPDSFWPVIVELKNGAKGIVRFDLDYGVSIKVMFKITFFGTWSSFGAGHYYGLDILETPNLTMEIITNLRQRHFKTENGPLSYIYLRADKFYHNLTLDTHISSFLHECDCKISKPDKDNKKPLKMKIFVMSKENPNEEKQEMVSSDCPICYMDLDDDTKIKLNCGHVFCKYCLLYSIDNPEDRSCPSDTGCVYKLTVDDVQLIQQRNGLFLQRNNNECGVDQTTRPQDTLEDELLLTLNAEEFECSICLKTIKPMDGIELSGCHHKFCGCCLINYAGKTDHLIMKCPYVDCLDL